jgi:ABC-type oligopeptide transport system substrate-binding subunit
MKMKKVLSIVMVVMLLAMTVVVFASCSKPADNAADAKAALEGNGYTVSYYKDEAGNEFIHATKGADYVSIAYYVNEADADAQYAEAEVEFEELEKAADENNLEFNLDIGQSGSMIWMGTEDAIDAAK